jgi:hypothetical protein
MEMSVQLQAPAALPPAIEPPVPRYGEEKNLLPLPGIELRPSIPQHVATYTELSGLSNGGTKDNQFWEQEDDGSHYETGYCLLWLRRISNNSSDEIIR